MRKHVTPAEPTACIPDPSRGRDLPRGGAEVDWTPYWASMEVRKEVTVRDVVVEEADAAPATVVAMPTSEREAVDHTVEVGSAPQTDDPDHETHTG